MRPTPTNRAELVFAPSRQPRGMIRFGRSALAVFGAGCWLAAPLHAAEPAGSPPFAAAWQALSVGSYEDAGDQFARAGADRQARLGAAIALINRPPVTPSSLAEAQHRFTELARGPDETAHAARYFLGRMQQLHPIAPDPVAAAREYEALVATGADDLWCRLALLKLAILHLTVLPGPGEPAARFAAVEPMLARTQDDLTRRDLHLVIAEARMSRRVYDPATLGHLQAALAATAPDDALRPDLLVQTGRLASLLGDRATVRASYEAFLRDYPKDRRWYTVNSALAHVDGSFPP